MSLQVPVSFPSYNNLETAKHFEIIKQQEIRAIGETIYVPDNYTSIQEAINHAHPFDTIIVRPGIYNESITINVTCITLKSELGANVTILNGDSYSDTIKVEENCITISGFTITNGSFGIHIEDANYSRIYSNIFMNNNVNIRLYNSHFNKIYNNTLFNASFASIHVDSSDNNTIYSNQIANNTIYGILVAGSKNLNISYNTLINNGMVLLDSYNNSIIGNTVNNKPLVYLENVKNIEITEAGQVIVVNSSNIIIRGITITNTDIAIELLNVTFSIVKDNILANNKIGIGMVYSHNNSIFLNKIENNFVYGASIYSSYNNTIFLNSFINNSYQVDISDSRNSWFSPQPIHYIYRAKHYFNHMGNYWSNYYGNDTNGDGIGDSAYTINIRNIDYYPLIKEINPYDIDIAPPVIGVPVLRPSKPVENENVTVIVAISDDSSGINKAVLWYKAGNSKWQSQIMTYNSTMNLWVGNIPSEPVGTIVEYYIEATDNVGHNTKTQIYSYKVADITPPSIKSITLQPSEPTDIENITIVAIIEDNYSGIRNVTLWYKVNTEEWKGTPMNYDEKLMMWRGIIPKQAAGSIIDYYIEAVDNDGNVATSDVYSFKVKASSFFGTPLGMGLVGGLITVLAIMALLILKKKRK